MHRTERRLKQHLGSLTRWWSRRRFRSFACLSLRALGFLRFGKHGNVGAGRKRLPGARAPGFLWSRPPPNAGWGPALSF
eukprot:625893-Prymnesium_polylepis.2